MYVAYSADKKLKLEVWQDEFDMNPRNEFDHVGTMFCSHRSYNLGDEQFGEHEYDFTGWNDVYKFLQQERQAEVILPLYLMDHSGITMRTGKHEFKMVDSAGWDWGQVGFIYATRKQILEAWQCKRLTAEVRAKAIECLQAEVEEYDSYLTGDVWGYTCYRFKTEVIGGCVKQEFEDIDSCGGFYGDHEKSGLIDNMRQEYKSLVKELEWED